jgi:hypothetical protein
MMKKVIMILSLVGIVTLLSCEKPIDEKRCWKCYYESVYEGRGTYNDTISGGGYICDKTEAEIKVWEYERTNNTCNTFCKEKI